MLKREENSRTRDRNKDGEKQGKKGKCGKLDSIPECTRGNNKIR